MREVAIMWSGVGYASRMRGVAVVWSGVGLWAMRLG